MQRRKSRRHVNAARARWRMAEQRAQAERDAGIEDRPLTDARQPIPLDLRSAGGSLWVLEPCFGKIAWKATNEEGQQERAALKTLLHRLADQLPRTLGERNLL